MCALFMLKPGAADGAIVGAILRNNDTMPWAP